MAKLELTYEISQKWWVKPLTYSSAYLFATLGRDQFPRWFTDFVVNRGYSIEWKK